jgi:hypothetical protein
MDAAQQCLLQQRDRFLVDRAAVVEGLAADQLLHDVRHLLDEQIHIHRRPPVWLFGATVITLMCNRCGVERTILFNRDVCTVAAKR